MDTLPKTGELSSSADRKHRQRVFLYAVAAFLIIAAALGSGFLLAPKNMNSPQQIACTMEAKQCANGTYVSRTGPKCEFSLCPDENGFKNR